MPGGYAPAVQSRPGSDPHRPSTGVRMALVAALVVIALVLVLVAAACGGGDDEGDDGTGATTSAEETAAPTSAPTSAPTFGGAATTATPSTTDAGGEDGHPEVPLRADGLGVTAFGDVPEYTVAALTAELGEPTRDTTESAFSSFGTCPGTTLRAVEWGGLAVLITDGNTAFGIEGGPHFFAYLYRSDDSLDLVTPEGIGLGSTVAELRAAYDEALRVNAEQDLYGPSFQVGAYGPGGIYGFLDGTDDASAVTEIAAGQPCGE